MTSSQTRLGDLSCSEAITASWRPVLKLALGVGLGASMLWGAPPAQAASQDIPYSVSLTFNASKSPSPRTLSGSFTLDCAPSSLTAQDCVTYGDDAGDADGGGWIFVPPAQSAPGFYYLPFTVTSVTWTGLPAGAFANDGIYGVIPGSNPDPLVIDDDIYFLQFFYEGDPGSNNDDQFITVYLIQGKTLPASPGQEIPVDSDGVVGPYQSAICQNTLPKPASISCPPGQDVLLSGFQGNVINLVPSPFGAALLLPALLVGKLRRRYLNSRN